MEMTPRMKQILTVLLREDKAISVKYLAEQIGVSKRTAQRELEYIDQDLNKYEITFFSKTGVGIWLEGAPEEKRRLYQELISHTTYDMADREGRRKRLILEILKEKGLKKLFYYSSKFKVSEATISADLEAIEGWLNCYHLSIQRKPGSGIAIEGSEENYRRAIRAFINENLDTKVLKEAYEEGDSLTSSHTLKKSSISEIFTDDVMERVVDCIAGMDHARILNLTENSYVGLIIHISIAINRILKNEVIEENQTWTQNIQEDEDFHLAQAIVRELEEEFDIEIPRTELFYICLHIKGAKHEKIQWGGDESSQMENRELQQLLNQMLDAFDQEKAYLLRQDDEFIQGLLAHLQPTLIRLLHGMHIQNPVLDDIKSSYPLIYEKCVEVAKVLEENTQVKVPEEEIGFLTVHFGAAMVRLDGRNEKIRKVQVGVVCSSGIGISRLMSSKLEKAFKERMVIITYGKNDITPYIEGRTDFFISSIPMEAIETPVIFVNPLLNEVDMEKIRRMTYQYERLPKKNKKEEDSFAGQLEEINLVAAQINAVIKHMEFFKVDNGIGFEELVLAVSEKMSPYSDRQEMIQEDLKKREQISTQVFAEFGFALLHTRTRGVIRPCFGICMTKNLRIFEDAYMKGISVVYIMLVPEDDNLKVNNDILGYISSMLIEEFEFFEVVARGDREEIRSVLSKYLKRYFNKYLSGLS